MLEQFVATNQVLAYLIVFGGMFIEGELFFLTASVFAAEGYLNFWILVIVTLVGVILGDIAWYLLGHVSHDTKLGMWINTKLQKYNGWLQHHFMAHYWTLAFSSKFLYYVNRLVPLTAGWNKIPFRQFLKIHVGAAAIWLGIMVVLSYPLRFIVEAIGVQAVLQRLEFLVIGLAVIFIGGEYLLKHILTKKIRKRY